MKVLIYGPQKTPDVSFKNDPKKGLTITAKQVDILNYEGLSEITWENMIKRTTHKWKPKTPTTWEELKAKLPTLTQTAAEKYFLESYFNFCEKNYIGGEPYPIKKTMRRMPALIPQVWINWLHFDPQDKVRAEDIKRQPQRVDFFLYFQNRSIIIEIDGYSHFSELFDVDTKDTGKIKREGRLDKYTEHLRKDRWLRHEGYEVWRFSDLEVLEIKDKIKNKPKTPIDWTNPYEQWSPLPGFWIAGFLDEMGLDELLWQNAFTYDEDL